MCVGGRHTDWEDKRTRKPVVRLQNREARKAKSQHYDCPNKTCKVKIPVIMTIGIREISQSSTPCWRATTINDGSEQELVFSRNVLSNYPILNRWSALETHVYNQHWMDSTGCIPKFICMYIEKIHHATILKYMYILSSMFYKLYSSIKHVLFNINYQYINSSLFIHPFFSPSMHLLIPPSLNLSIYLSIHHSIPPLLQHSLLFTFPPPSVWMMDHCLSVHSLIHQSKLTVMCQEWV